jgi:hypothetical protein
MEPTGGVGIAVLEEPAVAGLDPEQETWVLVRSGLVSVTMRAGWKELRSGKVPWADMPLHEL